MPLNVLIIPDKFKGTLTAGEAAGTMARGWRKARPEDSLELMPLGDGGDGFGEVMSQLIGASARQVETVDAAHRPCRARWWWAPRTRTAVIESAAVIGLAMLPPKKFHPYDLDSFGLGAVLGAASRLGARRCIVGIGGSATNDGGFGLARALGWEFLDRNGAPLTKWTAIPALAAFRQPRRRRWFEDLVVAVDVANPLLGARGATRIYGPQKGLRPQDFAVAEKCLGRLARVIERELGRDLARVPGAGAAGGLGFGLLAFAGARLKQGFELFSRHADLERRLRWAELVLTGEGAIDGSTLMGKGVGRVAQRCQALGIPCVGLAGMVEVGGAKKRIFSQVHALTGLTGMKQAQTKAGFWLERLAEKAGRGWSGHERARRARKD
jgi:glycerate kinase